MSINPTIDKVIYKNGWSEKLFENKKLQGKLKNQESFDNLENIVECNKSSIWREDCPRYRVTAVPGKD